MGQPISMKLGTEVALGEIFQKPKSGFVFGFLVPEFPGEVPLEASKS